MTDNFVSKKCCHCGTVAEYPMPSDFKVAVPKYLDGKPFEDGNFELKRTVMRCPKCGYASFDVSKSILKESSIVSSDEYESIIKSDLFPKYIANYIAIGYIYERQSEYYHASHAYLCAAWGCRDEKREKEAEILLEKAAKLILKHIGSSEFKAHPDLNMLQCAVDILRQIREFDNAKKLAAYALSKNLPEDMRKLFLLEQSLCDNYIYAPHAFKPQNETKITSLQELFNRFAEAKTGDDKMKLQAFADAFEFVNGIKYKDVEKGVWLVANPFLNQGFDFNKGVNLTRGVLTEKKAPQNAAETPIKPQQPVLKVFTKAEDLKPQKTEIPQEMAPVEEEIQVVETPTEGVTEPIEQPAEERAEEITAVEPPRPIKVFTSVDDLKAEEEVEQPEEEQTDDQLLDEQLPEEIEETFVEEQQIAEETEDVDVPEEHNEPVEDEWTEEVEQLPEETVEEESVIEEPEEDSLEEEEIEPETAPEEIIEAYPEDQPLDEHCEEDSEQPEAEEAEDTELSDEVYGEELPEEEIIEQAPVSEEETEQPEFSDETEDQPLEEEVASDEELVEEDADEAPEETAFEEEIVEETPTEPEEQLSEDEEASEEEIVEELPTEEDVDEPTEEEKTPEVKPMEEPLPEEEEITESLPDEPAEVTPEHEAQTESEATQQTPETETEEEEEMEGFATTYEEQCETITTLASIDGAISVSEVQSLFEYGFVKARDILNRMADDGLLERTDDSENFRYVK